MRNGLSASRFPLPFPFFTSLKPREMPINPDPGAASDDLAANTASTSASSDPDGLLKYLDQQESKLKGLNENAVKHGLRPLETTSAAKVPRSDCDACGAANARQKCGKCLVTFYCSRDCQKAGWKQHKVVCPTIAEDSRIAAEEIVAAMANASSSGSSYSRVSRMSELDSNPVYDAAVSVGLNDTLKQLFLADAADVKSRYERHDATSFSQWIVPTLFRANRRSVSAGMFKMDANRVKSYVRSSPEAWDAWFDAAAETATLPAAVHRGSSSTLRAHAHRAARDVWASFAGVFSDPVIANSILSSPEVATTLLKKLNVVLSAVSDQDGLGADPNGTVICNVNQTAAMIRHWCLAFPHLKAASENIEKQLGLKTHRLQMFKSISIPYAEGIIEKGRNLTQQESRSLMMRAGMA
jgi:hypothetical protein